MHRVEALACKRSATWEALLVSFLLPANWWLLLGTSKSTQKNTLAGHTTKALPSLSLFLKSINFTKTGLNNVR